MKDLPLAEVDEEIKEERSVQILAQLVENKPKQHYNHHNNDNSEDEDYDGYDNDDNDNDDDDDDRNQSPRLHWTR